jgi:Tfp pilus assembly protein PilF
LKPQLAVAWLNRGIARLENGKREEAKNDLAEAVKLNPALKETVERFLKK